MMQAPVRSIRPRRFLTALSPLVLALLAVACAPAAAPVSGPGPLPDEPEPTPTAQEELRLPTGVLTGTVTYLQRAALPPGSVIEVQLQNVSRADVAAEVIASQTITTAGENVPIPFMLSYDPVQINSLNEYAIGVRIHVDGQLRWINTERYAVLTRGAPITGVEVVVQPAQ